MTREEIVTLTNQVFEKSFEIEPSRLVPQAKIFEELGLDSLDIVDLIVALQKQFKVQIREDERVRTIRTLDDIYNFIWSLNQNKGDARDGG
jgi:acyl carrier protein